MRTRNRGYLPRYDNGTLDVRPSGEYIKMVEDNARNSPLLRLPNEIRNSIFAYAIGGQTFRVEPLQPEFWIGMNKDASTFSLLLVCRQVYSETAPLHVRANTFSARVRWHLDQLLFQRGILRKQIVSLQLDTAQCLHVTCAHGGPAYLDHALQRKDWTFSQLPSLTHLHIGTMVGEDWCGVRMCSKNKDLEKQAFVDRIQGLNPGLKITMGGHSANRHHGRADTSAFLFQVTRRFRS